LSIDAGQQRERAPEPTAVPRYARRDFGTICRDQDRKRAEKTLALELPLALSRNATPQCLRQGLGFPKAGAFFALWPTGAIDKATSSPSAMLIAWTKQKPAAPAQGGRAMPDAMPR